jgi:hypothetical protein
MRLKATDRECPYEDESYDASIAPCGSVTIRFTGSYTNSDAAPSSFAVNGTTCTNNRAKIVR